jgi:hypothetical protein
VENRFSGVSSKQATETVVGIAAIATQAATNAGTDDTTIVTPKKLVAAIANLINNTGAASDLSLQVGQAAYIDVSAASSVPLHIATGDNQSYEIDLLVTPDSVVTTPTLLLPNNATYTNFFGFTSVYGSQQGAGTAGATAAGTNGFALVPQGATNTKCFVSTKTYAKGVHSLGASHTTSNYLVTWSTFSMWMATASSFVAHDTTTPWTSLGTLTFPTTVTGRIIIRRTA